MKRRSLSSRLRHRVALEQPVLTPDGSGGFVKTWHSVATLWAQISAVESSAIREKLTDERLHSTPLYRIALRYRAPVSAEWRIVFGARIFNIRSVTADERNAALELLCEEAAPV